jgi:hypothetical protein
LPSSAWSKEYFDDGLTVSCLKLEELLDDMADGEKVKVEPRRLSLPAKIGPNGKRVWESGGKDSKAMPYIIKPATPSQETQMIACFWMR